MEEKRNLPLALIILDGWGHRSSTEHNALAAAHTPRFDSFLAKYPHALLDASQGSVGLPDGQIGNSEVGHMTIGSGKINDVDLVRISKAIEDRSFHSNPVMREFADHVRKHDSTAHIYGLVSPGGVHSHHDHLYALLYALKEAGVTKIAIHAFTDGRDVPPTSAAAYLKLLEDVLDEAGVGRMATLSGRFYAMDRDKNWDRVAKAEDAIFNAKGATRQGAKPSAVLTELYDKGVVDEHLEPIVFLDDSGKGYPLSENDGVFFFNFRADRARQLAKRVLEQKDARNLFFATMTEYDKEYDARVMFPPLSFETTFAAEVSLAGLTQAHIAETEKYAHVTYFFNGGREEPHEGEEHVLIESRRDVPTHDLAPEMRAREIADAAIAELEKGTDVLIMNFANADMVGHTANVPAIIAAVETVDRELGRVIDALVAKGGIAMITADHGNAEENVDASGERHTAHTLNLVPCIVTKEGLSVRDGTLADIAPTLLELMGMRIPGSMTGKSLLK